MAVRALYEQSLAGVVATQGEPAWAARLYGAAVAFRDANSMPIVPVFRAEYERSVAATRAQLGEHAFAAAWAEGRTMTPEQALIAREPAKLPEQLPSGALLTWEFPRLERKQVLYSLV